MRTTAVLVILLLTLGLSMGVSPALAEDAVMQPLPSACQTVSDTELSQLNGKFLGFNNVDWRQVACCVYQKLPLSEDTRARINCVVRTVRTFRSCFNNNTNHVENGTTTPQ
jgi:hypothetical protein